MTEDWDDTPSEKLVMWIWGAAVVVVVAGLAWVLA